jgi:pyrroloquinoline quinone biosynthesis protein B
MRVRVLGSAAGGGFPQWNCACSNCDGLRRGTIAATARTQTSLAVSADGRDWFILNVAPDVRAQLEAFPPLHPRRVRDTPISGIALTNGDVDACLGLFILRESQPLHLYATGAVARGLKEHNVLFRTLERSADQLTWHLVELGREVPLVGAAGPSGLTIEAVALPGKVPLHLDGLAPPSDEDNVGLVVRDAAGKALAFAPSVAAWTREVERLARAVDCLIFDGTFYREDELTAHGMATRGARAMAHWPLGGSDGSAKWLATLPCRKILVHINNTNPILREDAPERAALAAAGIDVAHDGLELEL